MSEKSKASKKDNTKTQAKELYNKMVADINMSQFLDSSPSMINAIIRLAIDNDNKTILQYALSQYRHDDLALYVDLLESVNIAISGSHPAEISLPFFQPSLWAIYTNDDQLVIIKTVILCSSNKVRKAILEHLFHHNLIKAIDCLNLIDILEANEIRTVAEALAPHHETIFREILTSQESMITNAQKKIFTKLTILFSYLSNGVQMDFIQKYLTDIHNYFIKHQLHQLANNAFNLLPPTVQTFIQKTLEAKKVQDNKDQVEEPLAEASGSNASPKKHKKKNKKKSKKKKTKEEDFEEEEELEAQEEEELEAQEEEKLEAQDEEAEIVVTVTEASATITLPKEEIQEDSEEETEDPNTQEEEDRDTEGWTKVDDKKTKKELKDAAKRKAAELQEQEDLRIAKEKEAKALEAAKKAAANKKAEQELDEEEYTEEEVTLELASPEEFPTLASGKAQPKKASQKKVAAPTKAATVVVPNQLEEEAYPNLLPPQSAALVPPKLSVIERMRAAVDKKAAEKQEEESDEEEIDTDLILPYQSAALPIAKAMTGREKTSNDQPPAEEFSFGNFDEEAEDAEVSATNQDQLKRDETARRKAVELKKQEDLRIVEELAVANTKDKEKLDKAHSDEEGSAASATTLHIPKLEHIANPHTGEYYTSYDSRTKQYYVYNQNTGQYDPYTPEARDPEFFWFNQCDGLYYSIKTNEAFSPSLSGYRSMEAPQQQEITYYDPNIFFDPNTNLYHQYDPATGVLYFNSPDDGQWYQVPQSSSSSNQGHNSGNKGGSKKSKHKKKDTGSKKHASLNEDDELQDDIGTSNFKKPTTKEVDITSIKKLSYDKVTSEEQEEYEASLAEIKKLEQENYAQAHNTNYTEHPEKPPETHVFIDYSFLIPNKALFIGEGSGLNPFGDGVNNQEAIYNFI